ncbi:MAG: glycosyltransferase [Leptospiraceae bacterium]|nr:glycosyltransferase [Leptospiraceae bacterium]MDW8306119.1 glycosyltransferase [Leptospiraceae bacterium]
MGQPLVSIVIPTLNEERYLPLLLESIQKQSFRDYEIIVADAFSQDKTREIAHRFGARVVDGGMPAVGRNRGAAASFGEWLFFFDADVVLPDGFLEKATQELEDRFYDLATCEFKPISELRVDQILFSLTNLIVKLNLRLNPRAAGFCIFILRRLFRRIGGFDETLKLAEDHDLVQRASKFRPLGFLENCHIMVSVRRLEKEGRLALIQKYAQVEWNLLFRGPIRDNIIEYEFGHFDENNEKTKRNLDELEARLQELERLYGEWEKLFLSLTQEGKIPVEIMEKLQSNLSRLGESLWKIFPRRSKT